MTIIVDHRERKSGVILELEKSDIPYTIQNLNTADFVIGTIGIERKTQYDFLQSITDKRLVIQIKKLKESFNKAILIVEGSENIYAIRDFHPNSIRGAISSIVIESAVPIIYTANPKDTAAFLKVLHNRLNKERVELSLINKRTFYDSGKQQEFILQSFPGIGPSLSKALLREFKTIKSIINADVKDLMKVNKIGKIKAKSIQNLINLTYGQDL